METTPQRSLDTRWFGQRGGLIVPLPSLPETRPCFVRLVPKDEHAQHVQCIAQPPSLSHAPNTTQRRKYPNVGLSRAGGPGCDLGSWRWSWTWVCRDPGRALEGRALVRTVCDRMLPRGAKGCATVGPSPMYSNTTSVSPIGRPLECIHLVRS